MTSYIWKDLPKKKTVFTVRAAILRDLDTGKIAMRYLSNTRFDVVQKCTIEGITYYRTQSAASHNTNLAFEAQDFGLPNEIAPSVPHKNSNKRQDKNLANYPVKKEKPTKKIGSQAKDGESDNLANKIKQKLISIFKK